MEKDKEQLLLLKEKLEKKIGKKLDLKINDNHSTMLSVKWESDCTKVSLHRMFLEAPLNIMQDLSIYLKKQDKIVSKDIKAYIQDNLKKLDYSHELDLSKLQTKGMTYDLKEIYDRLNSEYFGNELQLHITWFGNGSSKNRSRITFGLYYDPLKLIKIHRLLDQSYFPLYFVEYVVYHEMLHFVCPSYVNQEGITQLHTKEFKNMEKKFKQFANANHWIKEHKHEFFSSSPSF